MCGLKPSPLQPFLSLLYLEPDQHHYQSWKTKPNLHCIDLALLNIYSILLLSMSFFPPLSSPNATGSVETLDEQTETESVVSFRRERPRHRESMEPHGEELPPPQPCQDADIITARWSQEFNPQIKTKKA